MTHTLHRLGNHNNLKDDYAVLAMSAKGINEIGSEKALRRFMELAFELDPVNAGDIKTGNIFSHSRREILNGIQDISVVHAVFTNKEKITTLLVNIRKENLGISVIVSGLFDQVRDCASRANVKQHTIEYSIGVWGQTSRLPDTNVMQITTMCGHGMVASDLVKQQAREVRLRRTTSNEVADELARLCVCGIFNPIRAGRLLELVAFASKDKPSELEVAG